MFYYVTQEKEDGKGSRIFDLFQVEPAFNETLVLHEIGLIKIVNDPDISEQSSIADIPSEEIKVAAAVDKDGFITASSKRGKGKKGIAIQLKDDAQDFEKQEDVRTKNQQSRFNIAWDSDEEDEPIASNNTQNTNKKTVAEMFWTCTQCTFVNEFVNAECAMCYSKNENDSW